MKGVPERMQLFSSERTALSGGSAIGKSLFISSLTPSMRHMSASAAFMEMRFLVISSALSNSPFWQ